MKSVLVGTGQFALDKRPNYLYGGFIIGFLRPEPSCRAFSWRDTMGTKKKGGKKY